MFATQYRTTGVYEGATSAECHSCAEVAPRTMDTPLPQACATAEPGPTLGGASR